MKYGLGAIDLEKNGQRKNCIIPSKITLTQQYNIDTWNVAILKKPFNY